MADEQARPELAALNAAIDRTIFSLKDQLDEAERLVRTRGISKRAALALAGRNFLASQAEEEAALATRSTEGRVTITVPSGDILERRDPTRPREPRPEPIPEPEPDRDATIKRAVGKELRGRTQAEARAISRVRARRRTPR